MKSDFPQSYCNHDMLLDSRTNKFWGEDSLCRYFDRPNVGDLVIIWANAFLTNPDFFFATNSNERFEFHFCFDADDSVGYLATFS